MTYSPHILPVSTPAWVEEIGTDDTETTYSYHPVLAWEVADDGTLWPIVAFGDVGTTTLRDTEGYYADTESVIVRILRTAPGVDRTTKPRVDHLSLIRREREKAGA